MCVECIRVLNSNELLRELNKMVVVLIPRKDEPEHMGDLRPISLCNVLYKIISKVLLNRLKLVLPTLISSEQSAFLKGRLITDNVQIAVEAFHFLKRKRQGEKGVAALKLDMSKAYNRLEWGFLKEMMKTMGFGDRWVKFVMMCVSSVCYSILTGGELVGPIILERGLCQGDPLSLYLLILCAEGLSLLLSKVTQQGKVHGCRVVKGVPSVSHLAFADDALLFFKAKWQKSEEVKRLLVKCKSALGQCVNF